MREQSIYWEYWSACEIISLHKTHIKFHRILVLSIPGVQWEWVTSSKICLKIRSLFLIWFDFYLPFYVKAGLFFPLLAMATTFLLCFFKDFLTGVLNISGHATKLCNYCQLILSGNYQSNPALVEGRSRRL